MPPCPHPQRKRHAQLRHQPRSTPLWVGDPDDWAIIRQQPRPPLVCPHPGCEVELVSCERPTNRNSPRYFRLKPGSRSCDHWIDHTHGGGPESAQHEWVKYRLTKIARHLGYEAIAEHPDTRADVFVYGPRYCLEVQLRSTGFHSRTASRQAKRGQVCWWIVEGPDTKALTRALFSLPAVRFRVIDKDRAHRGPLAPWLDPNNRDTAFRARLQVFGTIAHPPIRDKRAEYSNTHSTWFRTGPMDGYLFLEQILSGHRRWYAPHELGHRFGLWALDTDVDAYRAFRSEQRSRVQQQAESTPPVAEPHPVDHVAQPPTPTTDTSAAEPICETTIIGPSASPAKEHSDSIDLASATSTDPQAALPLPTPSSTRNWKRRWWQFWRTQ